jgi:hypothetical protein
VLDLVGLAQRHRDDRHRHARPCPGWNELDLEIM